MANAAVLQHLEIVAPGAFQFPKRDEGHIVAGGLERLREIDPLTLGTAGG
jgi:hypothetical protein